jgi:hypothetical protein
MNNHLLWCDLTSARGLNAYGKRRLLLHCVTAESQQQPEVRSHPTKKSADVPAQVIMIASL